MTTLRISEVADRAGISTATVRYYERVGVLPVPDRSPNGYRCYDESTVERLGFIARAKQLGCTLDEISDLVIAWEGGRCGPVQDRLRALVADKLAGTRSEIDALVTFSDELVQAAAALEAHRPDGPCDDRCGCLNQPSAGQPIALSSKPQNGVGADVAIACSLSAEGAQERVAQWRRLLNDSPGLIGVVTARVPIAGGIRLEFDDRVDVAAIVSLARAEHDCCRFFGFAVTIDERGVGLDITAPADAQPVLDVLFGGSVLPGE